MQIYWPHSWLTCTIMQGLHAKNSAQTPALFCCQCVLETLLLPSWSFAETARNGVGSGAGIDKVPN